jgi:hypothetical protein
MVSGVPPGNETRFQISGNAWHLLQNVPDLWQCYIRFQLSLAMLHHVFDLWQCYITFPALSGNVT